MAPCLLGLLIVAPEGIPLLLSEKWRPATTMFQVMCFVWFLRSICDHFANLFKAIGKPELVLNYQIVNSFLFLGVFFLAIKNFGETGIYFAWLAVAPLAFAYYLTLFTKVTGISSWQFLLNMKAPLISAAIMTIACIGVRSQLSGSSLILPATIVVGALSYPLSYYLLFKKEAESFLKTLLSRDLG